MVPSISHTAAHSRGHQHLGEQQDDPGRGARLSCHQEQHLPTPHPAWTFCYLTRPYLSPSKVPAILNGITNSLQPAVFYPCSPQVLLGMKKNHMLLALIWDASTSHLLISPDKAHPIPFLTFSSPPGPHQHHAPCSSCGWHCRPRCPRTAQQLACPSKPSSLLALAVDPCLLHPRQIWTTQPYRAIRWEPIVAEAASFLPLSCSPVGQEHCSFPCLPPSTSITPHNCSRVPEGQRGPNLLLLRLLCQLLGYLWDR